MGRDTRSFKEVLLAVRMVGSVVVATFLEGSSCLRGGANSGDVPH